MGHRESAGKRDDEGGSWAEPTWPRGPGKNVVPLSDEKALEKSYEFLGLVSGVRAQTCQLSTMPGTPSALKYMRRNGWASQVGEIRTQVVPQGSRGFSGRREACMFPG